MERGKMGLKIQVNGNMGELLVNNSGVRQKLSFTT
jgi:hypothetical protein